MAVLTLLLFFVIAAVNWIAVAEEGREDREVEWVAKPAALAMLLLFAATGSDPSFWLVAALALSLLGDIYLMLPGNLFVAGLSAFLLAHVAYVFDFDASPGWRLFWFLVVGGLSLPLTNRILGSLRDPGLRPAVIAYMVVILFMLGSAIASGSFVAALGALLFVASDSMIAWSRFVNPFAQAHLWIMMTYHLGQLLLVTALRSG